MAFDPTALSVAGDVTLLLGRRRGSGIEARRVECHRDVRRQLRQRCKECLNVLRKRTLVSYGPDTNIALEPGKYLSVRRSKISKTEGAIEVDPELLRLVDNATESETLSAADIGAKPFLFYAVVVENPDGARVAFIRKVSPVVGVKPGFFLAGYGQTLTSVTEPMFVFHPNFDIVLTPDRLLALNQVAFEQLFRDVKAVVARYPDYVAAIASALPIEAASATRLVDYCTHNSGLARKLRAIKESGHLSRRRITLDEIRAYAAAEGLVADSFIDDDHITFTKSTSRDVLKLLNEDLYTGRLSGRKLEASAKTSRAARRN